MFKKENIKNWKLVEVLDDIELIDETSQDYVKRILIDLKIPVNNHKSTNREFTEIKWSKMDNYFNFF